MIAVPNFTDRLKQLIGSGSVSSSLPELDMSNVGVTTLLASWLEDLGFAIQIQEVPGFTNKQNLIAQRGTGPGGLIFSGHTDTVPFDANGWNSDPFAIEERNNAFYGLGTSDMKGFFSVIIDAIVALENTDFRKPLTIVATADEECSMAGARLLHQTGIQKADFAIIGEPTNLKPKHMHKGMMMELIRIQGQSGHSSDPSLGNNALDAMHDVISALRSFRYQLQLKHSHPGFHVTVPTLNLGCIRGGDSPNRICGQCELQFDLRPLPGMSIDALREDISALLEPIAQAHDIQIAHEVLFDGVEAFEQATDADFVREVESLSGQSVESVGYATEAPFFKAMNIDTLVLGPGSIDQAHQPNEFIPLDQINPGIDLYKRMIQRFCL